MAENDIITAYETEFGVTVHRHGESDDESVAVEIQTYAPDDEDFIWALEQARKLSNG